MSRKWQSAVSPRVRREHGVSTRMPSASTKADQLLEKWAQTDLGPGGGHRRKSGKRSPSNHSESDVSVSLASDPWEISYSGSSSESDFSTNSDPSSESESDSESVLGTSADNDISRASLWSEGEHASSPPKNSNALDLEEKLKVDDDALNTVAPKTPSSTQRVEPETAYSRGITGLEAYNVITSGYSREYGSKLPSDISVSIEYVQMATLGGTSSRRDDSVFQWLHLKQEAMDFDSFSSQSTAAPKFCFLQPTISSAYKIHAVGTKPSVQSRLHPAMTLLQSRYPSSTKSQDMAQAVCSLGGTPVEHCFHALTLWCLTINNKYLLTAGNRLSAKDIAGDRLNWMAKLPTSPAANPTGSLPEILRVLVNDRLYILPLQQCDTWFAFTQNFSRFALQFDEECIIHFRGHHITPELWPLVINHTRQEVVCVLVSKRKRPLRPSDDTTGKEYSGEIDSDRLSVSSKGDATGKNKGPSSPGRSSRSKSPYPGAADLQEFHVLIWNAIRLGKLVPPPLEQTDSSTSKLSPAIIIQGNNVTDSKPPGSKSARELLHIYLNSLDTWLAKQKDTQARALYEKVSPKSSDDVQRAFNGMVKSQLDNNRSQTLKTRLFESVKQIFQLFVPLDQRGTMCGKFWGAVHNAITIVIPKGPIVTTIKRITSNLSETASVANKIKAQLSNGRACSPETFQIPPDALRAWHSFLLCLLFMSTKEIAISERHAQKCRKQLQSAHRKLVRIGPTAKKLKDVEVMLPNGLATCIIDRVASDFCGERPNVVESYWEYFHHLELKSARQPRNREIQTKLSALDAEVSLVIDSLESQSKVIEDLKENVFLDPARSERYFPDSYFHEDPAQSILRDCISNLGGKSHSLTDLRKRIDSLLEKNAKDLHHNKNQQEAAIYVFTIVTIIFLPVSTGATVLGMNTIDIRDMERSQLVFWAIAIPLTALVVIGALLAAGVWEWPSYARMGRSKAGGMGSGPAVGGTAGKRSPSRSII